MNQDERNKLINEAHELVIAMRIEIDTLPQIIKECGKSCYPVRPIRFRAYVLKGLVDDLLKLTEA